MEMLKRSFDDFEKRQEEEGVPAECLLPILVVVGIHPDKRDLEDALMELVDLDLQGNSGCNFRVISNKVFIVRLGLQGQVCRWNGQGLN